MSWRKKFKFFFVYLVVFIKLKKLYDFWILGYKCLNLIIVCLKLIEYIENVSVDVREII